MLQPNSQQGYALLLLILIVFSAGSIVLVSDIIPRTSQLKHLSKQHQMNVLHQVKANLMLYATSTPEIYATETNGNFFPAELVAAPGFLPCPDTNNNGSTNTPCGGTANYVIGRLPDGIATRHFQFIDNQSSPTFIWYVVDSRYVIQNTNYNNATIKRYSPLNIDNPGNGSLTLDNHSNLVAIMFISTQVPAKNTDLKNFPLHNLVNPNQNQFSRNQTLAITISHAEWASQIQHRAQQEASYYCQLPDSINNWFNLNWRNLLC